MTIVDEFEHDDVLYREKLESYLGYVDGLKYDADDDDLSDEQRAEARLELDGIDMDVVQQIRDMLDDTSEDNFISENYWEAYAAEYADDCLLQGVPQQVASYFDYDSWARDMQYDYTAYTIDGTTYYVWAY